MFWLRGDGEGDRGVDEVEGAALVGGGFGELVDFDVVVVVADPVAGELDRVWTPTSPICAPGRAGCI